MRHNVGILLNGYQFPVTANLESALRHTRHLLSHRMLWVDAICINQQDISEKERQISIMHQIYDQAERVIVWLGPAGDAGELGMTFAETLYSWVDNRRQWIEDELHFKQFLELDGTLSGIYRELLVPALFASWTALFHILCRRWWSRAWILQELLVARDVTVFCGSSNIPWSIMVVAISVCWNVDYYYTDSRIEIESPDGQAISHHMSRCYGLAAARVRRLEDDPRRALQPKDLDSWLVENRDRFCSLPHDKIYSVIGLLNPAIREKIRPDYTSPITTLYKFVVKRYVEASSRLSIICSSQHSAWQRDEPSWMPDWGRSLRAVPFTTQGQCRLQNSPLFDAAVATFSRDLNNLTVRGTCLGKIKQTDLEFSIFNDLRKGWRNYDSGETMTETAHARIDHRRLRDYGEGGWWWFPDTAQTLFKPAFDTLSVDHPELHRHRVLHLFLDMVHLRLSPTLSDWYKRHNKQSTTLLFSTQESALFDTLFHHLQALLRNRTLIETTDMRLGIGSEFTKPGDWICMLFGCPVPVILREQEGGTFSFLGDAFMHQLGDGDVLNGVENKKYCIQDFVLI